MILFCLGAIVGGLIGVGAMAALIQNDKKHSEEYYMQDTTEED